MCLHVRVQSLHFRIGKSLLTGILCLLFLVISTQLKTEIKNIWNTGAPCHLSPLTVDTKTKRKFNRYPLSHLNTPGKSLCEVAVLGALKDLLSHKFWQMHQFDRLSDRH